MKPTRWEHFAWGDIVVEALQDRRWTWMIPIKDHEASLGVVMPIDRYRERRDAGEEALDILLNAVRGTKVTKDMELFAGRR